MHRFLTVFAITLVVGASCASAQFLSIGPTLIFKAGVNAGNIPDGEKTGMNINVVPDFAVTGLLRFAKSSDMGATLDLGYTTYTYRMRPESEALASDRNTFVHSAPHFTIAPGLYFSGFQLGVAFGFPGDPSAESVDGSVKVSGSADNSASPAIEVRVGGMVALWKHDDGVLNAVVHGSYLVTGLEKDGGNFNPTPASFGIGINYLFKLIQ